MRRRILFLCAAVCVVIMVVSGVQIVSYYGDYLSAEQASEELRAAYYEHMEEESAKPVTPTPTPTATPAPTVTPAPQDTPAPTATPKVLLEAVPYPDNPFSTVRSRFKKIQRQNEDIIGWLNIEGVLDEAVVQRDNSYYLTRDYRGYHNSNGALFLDEECDLSNRPYTLMIYGHNMKTGAMFGSLRNYEYLYFYKENPFITFDSAYEDGRYVIVAVGNISTDVKSWTFVNFAALLSNKISQREAALKSLMNRSIFGHEIEVTAEDQLLILLTCVGDETERRVVVARRIRPEESEEDLHRLVYRSWEKNQ
ncbi:MAG: class B sortase [Clostridia bacterium]|nr:class B sortase [Clostridia bacterium]